MYELGASQGTRDLLLYPTRGLSLHPYVGYRSTPTWGTVTPFRRCSERGLREVLGRRRTCAGLRKIVLQSSGS